MAGFRQVEIPAFRNGVARASFYQLCGKPLGAADYLALADAAGLPREALCLDVGVGFGSSPAGDLALIARLPEIVADLPSVPVLVGASRKRVVADVCGDLPAAERLPGTLALHTVALWNGAHILRVHDVAEAGQAAQIVAALRKERI